MTAQDQQSRAEFEDGKWYWVEHEGWGRAPSITAPALYKANCDAWYSFEFSGISTRFLKVLGPCERQAARALPAGMEPVAWVDMAQWPPIRWPAGSVRADFRDIDGMALYTAAQVQAMGRVPPGWQAVPVEPTPEMMLHKSGCQHHSHDDATCPMRANRMKVWAHMLAAAPRPPATQERYQLLVRGVDTIQAGDEFLQDDAATWQPDPNGILVGMTYVGNALLPARRAIEPTP